MLHSKGISTDDLEASINRGQSGPIDALFPNSTVQNRSGLALGWDGVVVERRICPVLDHSGGSSDLHHLILWQGDPVATEREYLPGKFTRLVKRPGTLSIGLAGRLPAVRAHGPVSAVVCTLDPTVLRRVITETGNTGFHTLFEHMGLADRTLATLLGLAVSEADNGGPNGQLYGDSISHAIISRFLNIACVKTAAKKLESCLPQPLLRRVLDKIGCEYDRDLSLSELATESGYSRAHFLRMFRASTGKTPHRYLSDLRLDHARKLLLSNSASILDVAVMTGFSSHSHLTRLFRQRFGVTPSAFRRMNSTFVKA